MHVLVHGTGAVGGYFGRAPRTAAGHEVTLVARGANLEALRRDGLRVLLGGGDRTIALHPVAGRSSRPADAGAPISCSSA